VISNYVGDLLKEERDTEALCRQQKDFVLISFRFKEVTAFGKCLHLEIPY